jgi:hypothetical protein
MKRKLPFQTVDNLPNKKFRPEELDIRLPLPCYFDILPPELIDEIINHSTQIPAVSKTYFYVDKYARDEYLKRRRWMAGLGLTVRYLLHCVFPSHKIQDQKTNDQFDYSLAHQFTFGKFTNDQHSCNIALRGTEMQMLEWLQTENQGSWLFYFGEEQQTIMVDFNNRYYDYYIGNQGQYSYEYCIRKQVKETESSIAKMMIKLSDYVFVELLVQLDYHIKHEMLYGKVERLHFVLLRPNGGDRLAIWKSIQSTQYKFLDSIQNNQQLNVIHISGHDYFDLNDGLEWLLFGKDMMTQERKTTHVIDFLEQRILQPINKIIERKLRRSLVIGDDKQVALKLCSFLGSTDCNPGNIKFSNINWRVIMKLYFKRMLDDKV